MNISSVYRNLFLFVVIGIITLVLPASQAAGYPEPAVVPTSWEFDFTFDSPHLISVKLPGETHRTLYWYFTYTITNNSDQERMWVPQFEIYTNKGQLIQTGKRVSTAVFDQVKLTSKNPLLESPIEVVGKILLGDDNARDSVVIWQAGVDDIDWFEIFVVGLSGETQLVTDPIDQTTQVLRKTMSIKYQTPGDEIHFTQKPIEFDAKTWIMR